MIFLGFAFLMTFIRQAQLSTICYNWIISVWAMQWAILSCGFWNQIIISEGEVELKKLDIDLSSMVTGDFGAAAAMITFGCVLGKCNLQQLFFLIFWEMIWYGLNGAIGFNLIKATDMGGSMFIHTFGAYYGLAATYFFQGKRAEASKNMKSDYNSEVTALIGTLFLWMYYPSFNGALCTDGVQQQRVFVNTILAMCGGTMGATSVSRIMFGKLEMEIMLNAALGGGVGIGTSSDIIVSPYASLLIGFFGGALSAWSFKKLGPFLQEKINLQDTCGVHSLHGLPGIYGGSVSMVAIALSSGKGFDEYFPRKEEGIGAQVASQFFGLILTISVSIFAGATGGLICSMKCFNPVSALFKDDDHIEEATGKYPKKFLMDTDETYPIAAIEAAE
jgi:ammonium transporter Rh